MLNGRKLLRMSPPGFEDLGETFFTMELKFKKMFFYKMDHLDQIKIAFEATQQLLPNAERINSIFNLTLHKFKLLLL